MIPYTFLRWTCLLLMLAVGPINPFVAFVLLCAWAGIGYYQYKTGQL